MTIASHAAPLPAAPWNLSLSTREGPFLNSDHGVSWDLRLISVLRGNGWLTGDDGTAVAVHPNTMVILPAGSRRQFRDEPNDPLALEELKVHPKVLEAAALDARKLPEGVVPTDADQPSQLSGLMRRIEIERERNLAHSCALVTGLTLRLLADLTARQGSGDSTPGDVGRPQFQGNSRARMKAYVQDLEQHFFKATSLNAAAESLGLSRRRFTQLFRLESGTSWLAHVRKLRIRHSQRLLTEPQRTVLSIAFECGFEDLSTFYRAFKREVGVSPNLWRQG